MVRRHQQGTALLVVVGLLGFLTLFASAFPGLTALQAIMTRRFTARIQAHYLARAGIEIALGDLADSSSAATRPTLETAVRSSHSFSENEGVDLVVLPAQSLLETTSLAPLNAAQLRRLRSFYTPLLNLTAKAEPGGSPKIQMPRMLIVAKGRAGAGKRRTSTVMIAVLAEWSTTTPTVICWFEE
jgi:hypothetical protein